MFIVYALVVLPTCMEVSTENVTHLWHCKYVHLSFKGLDTLIKKDMANGMPSLKDLEETYSNCLMGKQHRETIPKHVKWRAKEKLELIHSYVCEPIMPASNGGSSYFITFIDDFSRKIWI